MLLHRSGELIDVHSGWPDAGVEGSVGGDQRVAAIEAAQQGVRVELVTAECTNGASAEHRHRGRVVLVGDSAWCVTLYAGMGVSAGLTGAERLGTVLERHPGDIGTALGEWEHSLRPYIAEYQKSAFDQRKIFIMDARDQIRVRRAMTWLRQFPPRPADPGQGHAPGPHRRSPGPEERR